MTNLSHLPQKSSREALEVLSLPYPPKVWNDLGYGVNVLIPVRLTGIKHRSVTPKAKTKDDGSVTQKKPYEALYLECVVYPQNQAPVQFQHEVRVATLWDNGLGYEKDFIEKSLPVLCAAFNLTWHEDLLVPILIETILDKAPMLSQPDSRVAVNMIRTMVDGYSVFVIDKYIEAPASQPQPAMVQPTPSVR